MSGSGELGGTDSLPPQDTAPAVPPYEGRRETADVDSGSDRTHRDGADVGAATGPVVVDDEPEVADPRDTPGGAVASPADDEGRQDGPDVPTDPGVGPAHTAGTGRAEDQS
jgi:hypothetical protein